MPKHPDHSAWPEPSGSMAVGLLLALVALAVLFTPHTSPLVFSPSPDAVEYSLSARNWVTEGRYGFLLGGSWFPPRYQPGFPLFILAPVYFLSGSADPSLGIYAVTICALLSVLLAFSIARQTGGYWAGVLAVLGLLSLPSFRACSGSILSEVPNCLLVLLSIRLWQKCNNCERPSRLLLAGVLAAISGTMKLTGFVLVLPWLAILARRRRFSAILLLLAPSFAAILFLLRYQEFAFGSPWRTGYHFWMPWPYDSLGATFSLSYLWSNLTDGIARSAVLPALFVALAAWAGLRRISAVDASIMSNIYRLLGFFLLTSVPLLGFHLLYFFPDARFFLPIEVMLVIAAACFAGRIAARGLSSPRRTELALVFIVLTVVGARLLSSSAAPSPIDAVNHISTLTPSGSVIVSAINPALLEGLAGDGQRTFMPVSRRIEYASKAAAAARLGFTHGTPGSWTDHRAPEVFAAGALDVIKEVALDNPEQLAVRARAGQPIYVETSLFKPGELGELKKYFVLVEIGAELFRLDPLQDGIARN